MIALTAKGLVVTDFLLNGGAFCGAGLDSKWPCDDGFFVE